MRMSLEAICERVCVCVCVNNIKKKYVPYHSPVLEDVSVSSCFICVLEKKILRVGTFLALK